MRRIAFGAVAISAALVTAATAKDPQKTLEERRVDFSKLLASNYGRDINEMIRRLGPPRAQYQMPNQHMVYTFDKSTPSFRCVMNFEADEQNAVVFANAEGCF